MKINKLVSVFFISSVLFLTSCTNDDSDKVLPSYFGDGILVSGQGSGAGTGSVTYISNDFSTTENLIYKKVNDAELGTFLQSMAFDDTRAFIIVDNANSVTVVDRYSFKEEVVITKDLIIPRYMVIVEDKGYVTNWGSTALETDDFIAVVNLNTYEVESTIAVANGPERIIAKDGKLYVSHKGGFSTNNVVSIIDIETLNVQEVTVKDTPDEMFFNNSGDLMVLSEGRTLFDSNWNTIGHTLASISTINTNSLAVSELDFAEGEHPSAMILNNSTLYFTLNGEVYAMSENATELPKTSTIVTEGNLNGIEIRNNNLFTLDTSYTDVSELNVYDLTSKSIIQTKPVALGASNIYFN